MMIKITAPQTPKIIVKAIRATGSLLECGFIGGSIDGPIFRFPKKRW